MVARLTEKGQVTIPKPLRDSLELEPGQELEFEEREGALIVKSRTPTFTWPRTHKPGRRRC